jgi:PAS domain S-box-containing protein
MSESSGRIRVLHVDDDRNFLDVASTFLEREAENISVEIVTSPQKGLEYLEDDSFDCLVSDYDMPNSNGIEFLETVREKYPDLPVILFTGKGSEKVAAEAISAGATDYIQKESSSSQYTVLANRIQNLVEQYRARRQSERANERRRRTLERITDGFTELDADLTFTDVNEQSVEFVDFSRAELLGMDYRELIADDASQSFVNAYLEVLETGQPQTVEARSDIHPDRWVSERIFPTEDGDGIFIYFRDITERKGREQLQSIIIDISSQLIDATEAEIDERIEEALQRIGEFEGADRSYVFEIYDDGERMDNTHEWCAPEIDPQKPELQNLETADFAWYIPKVKNFETVTVPNTRELPSEASHLRSVLESGNIRSIVTIPLTRGGELLGFIGFDWIDRQEPWSEDTIDLLEVSGNIIANAVTRKETITERNNREETLSALHDTAREIGQADEPSEVYDTLVDASDRIFDLNYAAVDIARDGYLVQQNWLESDSATYYEKSSLAEENTIAARAYNRQETIVIDDIQATEAASEDSKFRSALTVPMGEFGTYQTVSTEPGAFDDQDREFIELLVDHARVKLDQLTDKEALQNRTEELEHKNEQLEQFASLVSHDLRNPLNSLELSLEAAERTGEDEHFERSRRAVDRMEQLLEDLLTLARQGQAIDQRESISLAAATRNAWETVDTRGATLSVETEQVVDADRSRLKELLENLFRNAIEHGGQELTVTVGDCTGGFYVADDGEGIDTEIREMVFEIGYTMTDNGTGFGLAIAEEIVEAHGWDISVTESESGGARLEITGIDGV